MGIQFVVFETASGPTGYIKVGKSVSSAFFSADEAIDLLQTLQSFGAISENEALTLFQSIHQSPLSEYYQQDPLVVIANPLTESELLFLALNTILNAKEADGHDPSQN